MDKFIAFLVMTVIFAIALLIGEIWFIVVIIKSVAMGELLAALIFIGCFFIYRKFILYWTKKVEKILEDIQK